jgi:hypothetical protein
MKKLLLIAGVALVFIAVAIVWMWQQGDINNPAPPSANQNTQEAEIIITEPVAGALVKSPLTVSGRARGVWYFEAQFPVRLLDDQGKEVGLAIAKAQGDWMTNDFVPFTVTMEFSAPSSTRGVLIFNKDNPSGLPQNAGEYRVPVTFSKGKTAGKLSCIITGCSNQLCSDTEAASTCIYREEYACYRTAKCERQADGQCGWTETAELKSCLANLSK